MPATEVRCMKGSQHVQALLLNPPPSPPSPPFHCRRHFPCPRDVRSSMGTGPADVLHPSQDIGPTTWRTTCVPRPSRTGLLVAAPQPLCLGTPQAGHSYLCSSVPLPGEAVSGPFPSCYGSPTTRAGSASRAGPCLCCRPRGQQIAHHSVQHTCPCDSGDSGSRGGEEEGRRNQAARRHWLPKPV